MKLFYILIMLLATACSAQTNKAKDNASNDSIENKAVAKDAVFTIDLAISAGQGYSWKLVDSAFKDKLQLMGQTFTTSKTEQDGADGIQHFQFKGIAAGKVELNFIYIQPFVKPYPKDAKTKQFSITIQ